MIGKALGIIAVLFFLVSCQTPKGLSGRSFSLATVKKAVTSSLPVGLRKKSANGREFYSRYFRRPGSRSDRAYVVVKVLGDRRPYNIVVDVHVERKEKGQWVFFEKDPWLAKRVSKKIKKKLSTSRNERNVIDDFRAF